MHSSTGKICGSRSLMPKNATPCRVSSSPKPISFDYSIHNTVLENVPHTKYLGVTIQSNLKWDVHCKQVAAKATTTLNVRKQNLKSVIPSQGNNPAAPLTPHSTVMPSTSCKHGKE